jgi:hypothetical protein
MALEALNMENTLTVEPNAEEVTELQAAIQQIFDQMEAADARIAQYQKEIDQRKAETRALLAQITSEVRIEGYGDSSTTMPGN